MRPLGVLSAGRRSLVRLPPSALVMFRIYKHNKHPEYRLLVPREAELPSELQEEWTLCEVTDRIEAEQQEEIEKERIFSDSIGCAMRHDPPLPRTLVRPRA